MLHGDGRNDSTRPTFSSVPRRSLHIYLCTITTFCLAVALAQSLLSICGRSASRRATCSGKADAALVPERHWLCTSHSSARDTHTHTHIHTNAHTHARIRAALLITHDALSRERAQHASAPSSHRPGPKEHLPACPHHPSPPVSGRLRSPSRGRTTPSGQVPQAGAPPAPPTPPPSRPPPPHLTPAAAAPHARRRRTSRPPSPHLTRAAAAPHARRARLDPSRQSSAWAALAGVPARSPRAWARSAKYCACLAEPPMSLCVT
jgi:hypothetical protein